MLRFEQKSIMPRNKEYDRNMVLNKAMRAFWDYGYEATSVRVLEKRMGINQFSIYSSFSSKKNLFVEALRNYKEYVIEHDYSNLLKEDAKLTDLELFFHDFIHDIHNEKKFKGCLIVNTTGEMGTKDAVITRELNNYYGFIKNMLKKVLKNSLESGEISPASDIEKYSNYLLGIMQGLSVSAKVLPKEQVKDYVSVALAAIR